MADPDYPDGLVGCWITGDVTSWKKHHLENLRSSFTWTELLEFDRSRKKDSKLDDLMPYYVLPYLYYKFRHQIFSS
jgi:hypothetical protein